MCHAYACIYYVHCTAHMDIYDYYICCIYKLTVIKLGIVCE